MSTDAAQAWQAADQSWDAVMDTADVVVDMCHDDPALLVGALRRIAGRAGMSLAIRTREQVETLYGRTLSQDEWRRVSTSPEWLEGEWDTDPNESLARTRRRAGVWPRD